MMCQLICRNFSGLTSSCINLNIAQRSAGCCSESIRSFDERFPCAPQQLCPQLRHEPNDEYKIEKEIKRKSTIEIFCLFCAFSCSFLSSRSDFDRIKSENKSLKVIATRFRQLSLLVTCYLFVLRIRSYFHFQFIQRRRTPTAILTMRYRKGPK